MSAALIALWLVAIAVILLLLSTIFISAHRGTKTVSDLFSPTTSGLDIADVHATILSIIMAAVASYAIYQKGRVHEQEAKIFESVRTINKINFKGVPASKEAYMNQGVWLTADDTKRKEILILLERLSSRGPMMSSKAAELEPPPPPGAAPPESSATSFLTPGQRGVKILQILSVLSSQYPFRTSMYPDAQGVSFNSGFPERLGFEDVAAVRKWAADIKEVITSVEIVTGWHGTQVEDYFKAASAADEQGVRDTFNERAQRIQARPIPDDRKAESLRRNEEMMEEFLNTQSQITEGANLADVRAFISEIRDVQTAVEDQLFQYDLFSGRLRREQNYLLSAFILSGIAFLCGVVVPLFYQNTPAFILLWIPIIIYGVGFLFVIQLLTTKG